MAQERLRVAEEATRNVEIARQKSEDITRLDEIVKSANHRINTLEAELGLVQRTPLQGHTYHATSLRRPPGIDRPSSRIRCASPPRESEEARISRGVRIAIKTMEKTRRQAGRRSPKSSPEQSGTSSDGSASRESMTIKSRRESPNKRYPNSLKLPPYPKATSSRLT